jgi:S-adenosylmethionine:diacylglycerol 3-amino-3-carboxypropyl transferase
MAAAELLGDGLVDEAADEEAAVEEGSMAVECGEEYVIVVVGSCVKR